MLRITYSHCIHPASTRRLVHKAAITGIESIERLKTQSEPQTLEPAAATLRQKIQSSSWVQQLISGTRKCTFSGLALPKEHLIRIKTKVDTRAGKKSPGRRMMCVDELESYSRETGKSSYLPLSANGLFASLSDISMQRVVSDIGWVRSDVVEHCARVLRLRVVSAMHRARVDLFKHRDAPGPLEIPPRGPRQTTNPQIEEEEEGKSRLDILRLEITGRILRQDALWAGNSPYISLPQPTQQSMQHPEWLVPGILPAGGLQCIIKVPVTQTTPASVSSESTARDIWKTLAKTQPHEPPDADILDQSGASWMSYVIASPPKAQCEPTLSIHALEYLYHCLPALTLDTLSVVNGGRVMSKRQARKLREKSHGNMDPVVAPVSEVTAYASKLRSQAVITYRYTLGRSGHEFAVVQGDAVTKTVPVYYADEIFGPDVSATVINWLLSHASPKQAPEADGPLSSHYIGVAALPCTADLATQLHRLTVFAEN